MARLSLSLLGPFQAALYSEPLNTFESNKARALLAYLAAESERAHARSSLAALFWPDRSERTARTNLRSVLSKLRQTIGDRDASSPLLVVARDTVQFDAAGDCRVDVLAFRSLMEPRREAATTLQLLEQAVTLYRGPFLEGFSLKGSAAFDDWCLLTRERLHRQVEEALQRLAAMYEGRGELGRACEAMRRAVELEPWQEEAHRELMRLLALDGQRSAALAQYASCRRTLMADLSVEPAEETRALYERIRDGSANPASFSGPRRNFSLPLDPLIGREQEASELEELLRDPACRLITVLGPGGIGKSRLALQAASDQVGSYANGVFLVELAPMASPELLASAIMESLNVPMQGSTHPDRQLLNVLRDRNVLLLLDNFEHMIARAGLISQILAEARGVKLLVTSRGRLNVKEEWLFLLEGLRFPKQEVVAQGDGDPAVEIAALREYEAVELFTERARRVQPHFSLATTDAPSVARICRLVEGMPLAIELAAPWVRMMPCREIAEAIERDSGFLSSSLRGLPQRHRSMQAVFDHSWRLLSQADRKVLSRLSVFRGGFRGEAAEAVAGASLAELSELVDSSWLRATPVGRFEMHELVRQYASERLEVVEGIEDACDRHCEYFAEFMSEQESRLKGRGQVEALQRILGEMGNVRTAWDWAVARRRLDALDRCADPLYWVGLRRGWQHEVMQSLETAVAMLRGGPPGGRLSDDKALLLGRILCRQGHLTLFLEGFGDQAVARCEESVALLGGLPPGVRQQSASAFANANLGWFVHMRGDSSRARVLLDRAIAQATQAGDEWTQGYVFWILWLIPVALGDYSEAEQHLRQGIAIFDRLGDQWMKAWCLGNLPFVLWAMGEYEEAERLAQEEVRTRRELGDPQGIDSALGGLADAEVTLGKYDQARQHYRDSLILSQEYGSAFMRFQYPLGLGTLAAAHGEYEEAAHLLDEGISFAFELGNPRRALMALVTLGHVFNSLGRTHRALECFRQVLTEGMGLGFLPGVLGALVGLARVSACEGSTELAAELLALAVHHTATYHVDRARAQDLMSRLEPETSSDALTAAVARGQARDLQRTVSELLEGDQAND